MNPVGHRCFYTYILKIEGEDKFYIGVTNNLKGGLTG